MVTATKTRTIDGLKWECSEAEGLWFCGDFRIGRCDRRGRRSEWELFEANSSVWLAKTCTELMEIAARRIQG